MSMLRLVDIGKIYVSENNVSVGIRGVNLSFDRGEFVAITGASGSGKSTLLNVLSGMDTYEEGELFIEEQPTSHYVQSDWEEYRQKYISFIFQEYNILESFTVLQNVELALMFIKDPKQRRERALELIERVGLTKYKKQKGSHLSGGQKQRTVIARALAKDSPIILADEPTGNLDSETSAEIIKLLREVSVGKLLIMVTHNFDQVADVATRHVRIYDGSVESDRMIAETSKIETPDAENQETEETAAQPDKTSEKAFLGDGFRLGRALFCSKPKLSLFLTIVLTLGTIGIFFMTGVCGEFMHLFDKKYVFRPMDGRVIITNREGTSFSDEQLKQIAEKYGANDYLRYDFLLDANQGYAERLEEFTRDFGEYFSDNFYAGAYAYSFGDDYGEPDYGRYPQTDREVLLRLPLYYKEFSGFTEEKVASGKAYIPFGSEGVGTSFVPFTVCGVSYTVDNTQYPVAVFSREGFDLATSLKLYTPGLTFDSCRVDGEMPMKLNDAFWSVRINPNLDPNSVFCSGTTLRKAVEAGSKCEVSVRVIFYFGNELNSRTFEIGHEFSDKDITDWETLSEDDEESRVYLEIGVGVAAQLFRECMESNTYSQASLFFADDDAARKAVDALKADGVPALMSDVTQLQDSQTAIELLFDYFPYAILWAISVIFLLFFVRLCTSRSMEAFRDEAAILRSMGIPVRIVKTGIYVRMFMALLIPFILLPVIAWAVYHQPSLNGVLRYLHAPEYAFLCIAMIFVTWRVTSRKIRNMFGESVKKSLRGGERA